MTTPHVHNENHWIPRKKEPLRGVDTEILSHPINNMKFKPEDDQLPLNPQQSLMNSLVDKFVMEILKLKSGQYVVRDTDNSMLEKIEQLIPHLQKLYKLNFDEDAKQALNYLTNILERK